jgi:hypothetical protein
MGLDMYAYCATKAGARDDYYEAEYGEDETLKGTAPEPREIAYWRKHPNLHGWMHRLWLDKGNNGEFNGDELELTSDDIDMLEEDIQAGHLPTTSGFFFGNPADEYYRQQDLKFISQARAELFCGLRVFYNSSW